FFSSRRRHTRFSRDWSSDVCSSDLLRAGSGRRPAAGAARILRATRSKEVNVMSQCKACVQPVRRSRLAWSAGLAWLLLLSLLAAGPAALAQAQVVALVPKSRSEEHTSELQS